MVTLTVTSGHTAPTIQARKNLQATVAFYICSYCSRILNFKKYMISDYSLL